SWTTMSRLNNSTTSKQMNKIFNTCITLSWRLTRTGRVLTLPPERRPPARLQLPHPRQKRWLGDQPSATQQPSVPEAPARTLPILPAGGALAIMETVWSLSRVLPDFDRCIEVILDLVHHDCVVVFALDFGL